MKRVQIPLRHFFATPPTPCPYLPDRLERKVVTLLSGEDPDHLHEALSQVGFRRSQDLAYRPACDGCNACIPVRIPVRDFNPTKSHRRVECKNIGVTGFAMPPLATHEHFGMFQQYLTSRHPGGGMADMGFSDYRAMVEDTPVDTHLIEYRTEHGNLYGACLTDRMHDGLSLVYSFFDPNLSEESPGTYIILWHIERTLELGLDYVYLGYWIEDSPKMAYKSRFTPIEGLTDAGWTRF